MKSYMSHRTRPLGLRPKTMAAACLAVMTSSVTATATAADSITEALTSGKGFADIRMRYETVEQDNAEKDATAATIRTRVGYKTGSYNGFSALVEMEDSRAIAGQDEYSVPAGKLPPVGFNAGEYSVIADPATTEIDQAFIQYSNESVTAKVGAQVIALDGQRFIGHVGWRQDRATYDAVSAKFEPMDKLSVTLAHIYGRNRIFAEVQDQDSKDNLLNAAYTTDFGKIVGYAYLLEDDFGFNTVRDTYGISLTGSTKIDDIKVMYAAEYASQSLENDAGVDNSMDYMFLEAGAVVSGITAKIGYEVLGSDDGEVGFATPLATVHKFNGWADTFISTPANGLVDTYISVGTKVGPGKLAAIYHDFAADNGSDDYGSELDVVYGMKFGKAYTAGIKYADYSSDGYAVDTQKLWVWFGVKI